MVYSCILLNLYTVAISASAPTFATTPTTYTVPDSSALGTSVADIIFTDVDADEITITMSGTEAASFDFADGGTGSG